MEAENANQAEVLIEVSGIKKYFGSIKAVDDVSFEVRRGDILGFMGPTARVSQPR